MKSTAAALLAALLLASGGALANEALAKKSGCLACHRTDKDGVGPAYRRVAKKYEGQKDVEARLAASITNGGSGKWGAIPMPPKGNNPNLPAADIRTLAKWIASGAP